MPPDAALRRAVGKLVAVFGLLHLLPAAFVWLSSGGPAPILITARTWSYFFYGHFIGLTAGGLGFQALDAARTKLFHGGPLIDFLLGLAAFMLIETACAAALRRASWPALLPGLFLLGFGLRLATAAPLLGRRENPGTTVRPAQP